MNVSLEKVERTHEELRRDSVLDGMNAIVQFFRDNPQLEIPYDLQRIYLYVGSKEEMAEWSKALPKPQEKNYSGNSFHLRAHIGPPILSYYADEQPEPGVAVTIHTDRETVCTAKVTGTETVRRPIYADPIYVEETRDVIEWECDPILSSD